MNGAARFVRFPYEEMHPAYNPADLFVLGSAPGKSWMEPFGSVLAEALAAGVPIVSTLSGSIPEVVDGAAVLLPPADLLALRDAFAGLLENRSKGEALSRKGRARAEVQYDSRANARAIREADERLF